MGKFVKGRCRTWDRGALPTQRKRGKRGARGGPNPRCRVCEKLTIKAGLIRGWRRSERTQKRGKPMRRKRARRVITHKDRTHVASRRRTACPMGGQKRSGKLDSPWKKSHGRSMKKSPHSSNGRQKKARKGARFPPARGREKRKRPRKSPTWLR